MMRNEGQALVTGGTDGIGFEIARGLIASGMRVWIVGSNAEKGERASQRLRGRATDQITFVQANLALVSEARRLGALVREASGGRLDRLVHSAGVIRGERRITAEGNDENFAINFLSRFALTETLLPALRIAAPSRILIIAGPGQNGRVDYDDPTLARGWTMFRSLKQFQAANDIYTAELSRRLNGTGVTINVLSPGLVDTGIRRDTGFFAKLDPLIRPFMKTAKQAAEAPLALLLDADKRAWSGELFAGAKPLKPKPWVTDPNEGSKLWALATRLTVSTTAAEGAG